MPRESAIERADRKNHKSAGHLLLKFVSPGRNGMPDDILLKPIPPEHQELVARYFRREPTNCAATLNCARWVLLSM